MHPNLQYDNGSRSVPRPDGEGLAFVKNCPAFSADIATDYGNRFVTIRGISPDGLYLPASIQVIKNGGKTSLAGKVIFTTTGYVFVANREGVIPAPGKGQNRDS